MNDALWLVLDELVYAHNRVAPFSVFAMTNKATTRQTAEELLRIMPAFCERLRIRDVDWALMTPVKRRYEPAHARPNPRPVVVLAAGCACAC